MLTIDPMIAIQINMTKKAFLAVSIKGSCFDELPHPKKVIPEVTLEDEKTDKLVIKNPAFFI